MALSAPATPLAIALTQGGADAFVQSSVVTGLSGRQAYNLKGIAFALTAAALTALTAASVWDIQISVTRRSKTAVPEWSDNDLIMRISFGNFLLTSGAFTIEGDRYVVLPLETPIVEETIYAQMDSAGSGLANAAVVRLDVELDTISDIDRLNLITRSLS